MHLLINVEDEVNNSHFQAFILNTNIKVFTYMFVKAIQLQHIQLFSLLSLTFLLKFRIQAQLIYRE